jgi:AraC-like DNA-binding protein
MYHIKQYTDMNHLPLIEIPEITDHISISGNYKDSIILANTSFVQDSSCYYYGPVRLNVPVIAIVLKGSAKVNLDYVSYTVYANHLITAMPAHIVQVTEVSSDFKAQLLLLDKSFLENFKVYKRSPSILPYIHLRKNPCTPLSWEETAHIEQCFAQLDQKLKLRTHTFYQEVVQNAIVAFLLELANILSGKTESFHKPIFSRREEIINRFIQLLSEHIGKEHLVTFYAEKLFITPQYLSLVLKEQTGRPANKWIDDALIIEAKIRLKSPYTNIQQVADTLNFSDQSTFGKFFKKHTGISPTEYRKL